MSRAFDLDTALAAWRRSLAHNRAFSVDDLDELEQHVRDEIAGLRAEGLSREAAFHHTMQQMGDHGTAEREYQKVYWGKRRRHGEVMSELRWRMRMLDTYFKLALRNVRKHPGYSFLNVTGLAVGLACSLFILLWVRDELRYDRFLQEGDRIHQVLRNVHISGRTYTWSGTAKPLADVLKADYPGISDAVFSFGARFVVTHGSQSFREAGNYASASFFEVFRFPFLMGRPETALQGESSVVITERTARKLFGDDWQARTDILGQSLTIDQRKDFTITGIIADPPAHSSYQSDLVLPIQDFFNRNDWVEQWGNNSFPLYVKLQPGASPEAVSEQIAGVVMAHEEGTDETLFLQPYADRYLYSDYEDGRLIGGRIDYVRIFSVVAVFLLLIASINFMNLATARSARRAREIGVRKAVGAGRASLAVQFLGESLLTAFVGLAFALLLVVLLIPFFNDLTGKFIRFGALDGSFIAAAFGITLLVGLLSGSYPALYLSSFKPLVVLRGTFKQRPGAVLFRKGLVVLQFSLSVLLIVATVAVYLQIQYIRNKDLGLDREQLVYLAREGALWDQYDAFRQELLNRPGIAAVTAANASPLSIRGSTGGATWEGKDPDAAYEISILSADYGFVETTRMEVIEGRGFSRSMGADSSGYLINEKLARILGSDAVGRSIDFWGESGTVIGVVRDFEMNSLYNPIEPVIIRLAPEAASLLFVRLEPGLTADGLAGLESTYRRFNPDYPFDFTFLDAEFEAAYRSETVLATLAQIFAIIAIFISCLGLYGLISYATEQRTKEIGVRKVLGASVPHLVFMLTGEVTRLVLLGIVLAVPIAYLAVRAWLSRFADHVEMGAGMYVLAGLLAVTIAWLTVSYQSYRAARADPARSLRYE